jgi:hypothetical protein
MSDPEDFPYAEDIRSRFRKYLEGHCIYKRLILPESVEHDAADLLNVSLRN